MDKSEFKVIVDDETKTITSTDKSPIGIFHPRTEYLYAMAGYRFIDARGEDVTNQHWEPGELKINIDEEE